MSNKPGVLVIEGHIQGLANTRSLGETGIPVYIVDKNDCIAHYSRYCTKFFRCPDFYKDEFADFLVRLAIDENIRNWLLLPSNDHAVLTISKHKARLSQYFKVITPSLEIIQNIYNKLNLLKIAKNTGVEIPLTYYSGSFKEYEDKKMQFPLLIKGISGLSFYKSMKKKAFLVNNKTQLLEKLKFISSRTTLENVFVQELIPSDNTNHTISFTCFSENGELKTYWMGEKLREHPIRFGTATFARSVYSVECYTNSKALIKALNYTGICEIEYLKDPRDSMHKLIELNPRTWLWVELAKFCGIDFARIIYDYVNNIVPDYPAKYQLDLKWINWLLDIPFSIISILKGQLKFSDYFNSLKGRKLNALWSGDDKNPFFAYLVLLPIFRFIR